MKLIFILTMLTALQVKSHVLAQKITFSEKKISLEMALKIVRSQSKMDVFFNSKTITKAHPITISVKNATVKETLTMLFEGQPFVYTIEMNTIVVKEKSTEPLSQSAKNNAVMTTDFKVTGRVLDELHRPLPGVSILILGVIKGVATNSEGYYSIVIPKKLEQKKIRFSFIGMKPQIFTIIADQVLNVVMEPNESVMDEIVVTGYQNVAKRDMVGATSTVKLKDIENQAFSTVDKMLQGQVAGLIVTNPTSRATGAPAIKIRGTSTILGNTSPLWVVDGIIQTDPLTIDASSDLAGDLKNIVGSQISWLNPSDINTITVLKDASATAIYGSKASNGVIVITTNKGSLGKTKVSYGVSANVRTAPHYGMYNMMNSQERIKLSIDGFNAGVSYNIEPLQQIYTYEGLMGMYLNKKITKDEFGSQLNFLQSTNTDWFGLLTQNSLSTAHNMTVSGGANKITYLTSFSYNDNLGVEIGDKAKRITGRLRVNAEVTPKLNVDLNVAVSQNTNDGFGRGVNPMSYALSTNRALPAYDQTGAPVYYTIPAYYNYNATTRLNGLGFNFLNERDNSSSQNKNTAINSSLNLRWQFLKSLRYELVGGLNQSFISSDSYMGENTYYIANKFRGYAAGSYLPGSPEYKAAVLPFGGNLYTTNAATTSYDVQNKLIFEQSFNKVHRFNVLLMHELRSDASSKESNTLWGYSPERGQHLFQPTPPKDLVPLGTSTAYDGYGVLGGLYTGSWNRYAQTNNYMSMLGTMAYTYKNRYTLNANIRSEASNRFNQDLSRRLEPIWSVGLGWVLSDEPFMKNQENWLDQARFRASYGMQGNVLTNQSPNLIINHGSFDYNYGQYLAYVSSLPNPYLSREKTKNWNIGLDFRLFNFLTSSLEYYNRSSAVVAELTVPLENGLQSSKINGGRVTNDGYEYTLTFSPIRKSDMAWNISINGGKNFNRGQFVNPGSAIQVNSYLNPSGKGLVLKKGYDVSSFWSFSYKGLDPNTGRPLFNYIDKQTGEVSDPTDYLVYSGKLEPDFSGGISTSFRYKNLTLSTHFVMMLGRDIRLSNPYSDFVNGFMPDVWTNVDKELSTRWKQPGDEFYTKIPGLPVGGEIDVPLPDGKSMYSYDMWGNTDIRVVNGDFLRCNNLSLNYRFGNNFLKKYGIADLALTGSVNNLFVIASKDLNGFDPELRNRQVQPKTVSMGLNVAF